LAAAERLPVPQATAKSNSLAFGNRSSTEELVIPSDVSKLVQSLNTTEPIEKLSIPIVDRYLVGVILKHRQK
jgi:hypothetical protein